MLRHGAGWERGQELANLLQSFISPLEAWLAVSRRGRDRTPWYLLTNEPIATNDDAWRAVMAYAWRWQVEMCYRACKTDLAMESPRLWFWKSRLKLLLMVTLVYAFLISLLAPELVSLVQDLLRGWCHRTGEQYRQASILLPRLRAALSALWLSYPPKQHIRQAKCGMTHVAFGGIRGRAKSGVARPRRCPTCVCGAPLRRGHPRTAS